jgi:hypothetical protein
MWARWRALTRGRHARGASPDAVSPRSRGFYQELAHLFVPRDAVLGFFSHCPASPSARSCRRRRPRLHDSYWLRYCPAAAPRRILARGSQASHAAAVAGGPVGACRPSLARHRSVCVTKKAEELRTTTHTAAHSHQLISSNQTASICIWRRRILATLAARVARAVPVEAAGGLVEEEEARPHEELEGDADPPLLAAADPAEVPVSDDRRRARGRRRPGEWRARPLAVGPRRCPASPPGGRPRAASLAPGLGAIERWRTIDVER